MGKSADKDSDDETLGRIKNKKQLKGLQKLKFYCQMCRKQCRDANGFNCHTKSQSHVQQMHQLSENPELIINKFSEQFEKQFLDQLKTRYQFSTVPANKVYSDMIADKQHVHMNSTRWTSLTGFCKYLEQAGKVKLEFTDQGLLIENIDKSFQILQKEKEEEQRLKTQEKANKYQQMQIEKQIQLAKEAEAMNKQKQIEDNNNNNQQINQISQQSDITVLQQNEIVHKAPIEIELKIRNKNLNQKNSQSNDNSKNFFQKKQEQEKLLNIQQALLSHSQSQELQQDIIPKTIPIDQIHKFQEMSSKSAMDIISKNFKDKQSNNDKKQNQQDQDQDIEENFDDINWICPGIIVKILDKKLKDGLFYKKKAFILEIQGETLAKLQLLNSKEKIIIDQALLETVIPNIGGKVKILKPGKNQYKVGILESLQRDNYSGSIYLENEDVLISVPYELFSKIYDCNETEQ